MNATNVILSVLCCGSLVGFGVFIWSLCRISAISEQYRIRMDDKPEDDQEG